MGVYTITDRYDFYSTPEECVTIAAPRFIEQNWKWKRTPTQKYGHIPTEQDIRDCLLRLVNDHGRESESGRLAFYQGRFGVQKPKQPHVLIDFAEKP